MQMRTLLRLSIISGMIDPPTTVVARSGRRLTGARRTVAGLIAARSGLFTAADLVADAHELGLGIGRATIFRTLELFGELGVVERLDLPTGEHVYVGCEPRHHHHVVCERCGRTARIDDAGIREVVGDVERSTGYRVDVHRVELFGLCPECRDRARS